MSSLRMVPAPSLNSHPHLNHFHSQCHHCHSQYPHHHVTITLASAPSLTVNTMTALITPVTTDVITHFISHFKSPPLQCHPPLSQPGSSSSCHYHDQFHRYRYIFTCVTIDISVSPEPPLPSMLPSPPLVLLSPVPPAPQRCLASLKVHSGPSLPSSFP